MMNKKLRFLSLKLNKFNLSHKKAVELTMNTLIMAILGIVVLFILIAIFSGKITWFGGQYQKIGEATFTCAVDCVTRSCTFDEDKIPLKQCPGTSKGICCEPKELYKTPTPKKPE